MDQLYKIRAQNLEREIKLIAIMCSRCSGLKYISERFVRELEEDLRRKQANLQELKHSFN